MTWAVVVCFAILLGLGVWQVYRLGWKTDWLARIEALKTAPPRPLSQVLAEARAGRDVNFTRVETDCHGLAKAPWLELYAIRDGQAGSRLISACRIGAASILVDRGFVPDTISARPQVADVDRTPIHIRGVLRAPEHAGLFRPADQPRRWFTRDISKMAKALNAPSPAPYFLMTETSSNPEWKALDPAPLPSDIPNNHLAYAITWFGLAAALLGVYAGVLWGRRRKGDSA